MTVSIIDLEWTSWKGSQKRNWSLEFESKKIVEFGCVYFKNFDSKSISKKSFHFKIDNELSLYFTKLTNITNRFNKEFGKDFFSNFLEINRILNKSDLILANGFDKDIIIENFKYNNLRVPNYVHKINNISHIFAKFAKKKIKHVVSSELISEFNLNFKVNKKHRAVEDAYSIYLTLSHLIKTKKVKISELKSDF